MNVIPMIKALEKIGQGSMHGQVIELYDKKWLGSNIEHHKEY